MITAFGLPLSTFSRVDGNKTVYGQLLLFLLFLLIILLKSDVVGRSSSW